MMTSLWDGLVSTVFGCLLLATVAHNLGVTNHLLDFLGTLGLVPKWTFFAPTPGTRNFYLLYRDRSSEGLTSPWRVLHGMDRNRSYLTCIWNPERRLRKALHDLITALPYEMLEDRPHLFKLSTPYLLLITHVSSLSRLADAETTQFLIMEDYADERPSLVFCSELHKL
jgi:hypothetical protein